MVTVVGTVARTWKTALPVGSVITVGGLTVAPAGTVTSTDMLGSGALLTSRIWAVTGTPAGEAAIEALGAGAMNRELIGLGTPSPPTGGMIPPTTPAVRGGVMFDREMSTPPAPTAWTWNTYDPLGVLSGTVAVVPGAGWNSVSGAPLIPCQIL